MTEKLRQEVRSASLVLVGLGEELPKGGSDFYQALARLLEHKDYFIVSLSDNRQALEAAGLLAEQITVPLSKEEDQTHWDKYLHWLSFTLHQKLCILELGAGFAHPELIRFPFEKTCYFNQKSRLLRVHKRFWQLSEEIADRGVSIEEDPVAFLVEDREDTK